jgi:hypothetical protein
MGKDEIRKDVHKGIIIAIASENDNEIDKLVDYSIKITDF